MNKTEAFYKKLKEKLEESTKFPTKYMYKFIIPSDDGKILQIENIFNHTGAVINTKSSRTNKFTSVTIEVKMNSSDEIIKKYKEAAIIEGIISL